MNQPKQQSTSMAQPQDESSRDGAVSARPPGRDGSMRSKTMSRKEMAREMRRRRSMGLVDPEDEEIFRAIEQCRPRCRADCAASARPCLFISCKHHLYLDVNPETGSIKLNFPDKEVWELEATCALDVADKGGITLEEVGVIMNLTRERIRQVETRGLLKLREAAEEELDPNEAKLSANNKR
ncbi:MAG: DNA-binding protein [Myxococcales bacterium]|nr:DNA-binding protein [Myxococcales bacterium]